MSNYPERFESVRLSCSTELDETVVETYETPNGSETIERPERCGTELTFADHYVGMRRHEGYSGKVYVLKCPDCGDTYGVCPNCTDSNAPVGYFYGEQTNEPIPCNVCNQAEISRRRRRKGRV